MNHRYCVAFGVVLVGLLTTLLQAQQPRAARPPATAPAGSGNAATLAAQEPAEDPAVGAILATKPNTPVERVRAAAILADLNRPDLAKDLLQKVLDGGLTRPQWIALQQEIGEEALLALSARGTLQPEAKRLFDTITAAINAAQQSPNQVNKLIRQLQDPEKFIEAVKGLQEARNAAISPLIEVLADPARAAEHPNVRAALLELGKSARDALEVVVERAEPRLAVQAIAVLGACHDPSVTLWLLRPYLDSRANEEVRTAAAAAIRTLTGKDVGPDEAVQLLTRAAEAALKRSVSSDASSGSAELWSYDPSQRRCSVTTVTAEQACRATAARYMRDGYAITPDNATVRRLYLLTFFESAAYENGLDRPLDENSPAMIEAGKLGVATIENVLDYAVAHDRPIAATVAARLLGKIGKPSELLHRGNEPSPLVQATQSRDRRLRMAALEAIVRLQPTATFPSSSYIPQGLGFFAGSGGMRRALVASPSLEQGRDLAGRLAGAGFQVDTYTNGRELLFQAARSPDYELALIDVAIDRPTIAILLQQLRHDPRTAGLRVGLIARSGFFEKAEQIAAKDPLALALPRPHDDQAFNWQLQQLGTLLPHEFVAFEERQRQAAKALDLLAELGRASRKVYDLRAIQPAILTASYSPNLASGAVAVFATLNSAESQRALLDIASRFHLPLAVRQRAGAAFRENIQRHGILLTTDEIRQQYRRYNESEQQAPATRKVLSLILDSLEVSTAPAQAPTKG